MVAVHAESAVVVGGGLIGCEAASSLATRGMLTTLVAPEPVPLLRRFGSEVGERVAKMVSDIGVRFIGSATVTAVEDTGVLLDTGEAVEGELVVSAAGVCPDIRLATAAGLDTQNVASSSTCACTLGAQHLCSRGRRSPTASAGRRIPAEHWRDAAQQGRIAGQSAAGYPAAWDAVPEFSCTIGKSVLTYRGWGTGYEHSSLVEHRDGFTVRYQAGSEVIGVLSATTSPVA
jgi:NADPH-dependent 2,4-dienoyl-CoA reductase/sulfur reductase-like enzyme